MGMFDWDEMDRRINSLVSSAQKSPPGLAPEHLVPGAIVMQSPNLFTGDRSYTDAIFEVVAITPGHVALKWLAGPKPFGKGTITSVIHEHRFYPAEHVLDALIGQKASA
jgi:hypothetical protein